MKLHTTTCLMLCFATLAVARDVASRPVSALPVCIDFDAQPGAVQAATQVTSRLLASADVRLVWKVGFRNCPARALRVSLTTGTSPAEHPGAFGYALPYEGAAIRIFADRVAAAESGNFMPGLLGHVMAHEITHVLEGIVRHSEAGLMRANWTPDDHRQMRSRPMTLDTADAELIRAGLARR